MSHVDDGQLNALLDGELSADEARAVEAHVAECRDCARRLEEARAFLIEAGELLAVLTPPAPSAAAGTPDDRAASPPMPVTGAAPSSPAPEAAGPKVAKTAKEIAVSLDGRTAMTPAIRPVFPHEVPRAPRRPLDLEKLAWAASLILCLGVGYLANEVYHLRERNAQMAAADIGSRATARPAVQQEPAGPAPASEARGNGNAAGAAAPTGGGAASGSGTPTRLTRRQAEPERTAPVAAPAPTRTAAQAPKGPTSKPAPAIAQPHAEQLAAERPSNEPTITAAAPSAPTAAGRARDLRNAPAARSAAPAAADAGAPANRLDEVSNADSTGARRFAGGVMPAAFQRIPLEEAIRSLSGSVRLIDGLSPAVVASGRGALVPGADPDRTVVRITYADAGGQLVDLDQQLGIQRGGQGFNGVMPGDTLITTTPDGRTQVRWVDRKFWLSLTATGTADSVLALVARVR